MTEYNTAKLNYFKAQQSTFSSAVSKHTDQYELAAFNELTGLGFGVSIDKHIRLWFADTVGYADAYTSNLSDLWYRYLGSKGFSGSLRGRLKKFYDDGTINLSTP